MIRFRTTWLTAQIFLLVSALVGAGTQCLVRCASEPCAAAASESAGVPPCHGKSGSRPAQPTQQQCTQTVADIKEPGRTLQACNAAGFVFNLASNQVPLQSSSTEPDITEGFLTDSPPLSVNSTLSTVLKI